MIIFANILLDKGIITNETFTAMLPLVRRAFSLSTSPESPQESVLKVEYAATTNRMLRVAVNGFIESIGVVIGVMKELDTDIVYEPTKEGLEGVQGLDAAKVG